MPSDLVAMLEMELAQTLSLLCIGAAVTQLLPTISRVVRLGSVGSLPFVPHLVEACCRTWFCLYLWIVVRSRRPLAHAPAQGWLAGHDWVDLFLYGDTILGNVVVWLMLGLFVVYGESLRRTAGQPAARAERTRRVWLQTAAGDCRRSRRWRGCRSPRTPWTPSRSRRPRWSWAW